MKKIGGKSFWIILIISIISLIILTVGVIFLTRKSSKEFYSAGYIISSNASKSDKLYFNDNTVYKENVFNEYVFKDTSNKEVSTDKNNFIHYLDNSLSFMKNGVILDLDNINTSLVPYYNITDSSIIKYNNGSYYIETSDKTLIFGNFLGKITDDKYIVVGNDIRIKLAGSNEVVSGNYFEILFTADGVVKIENQEGSYQTVSDGSTIYVGDKIRIDLGEKNVYLDDENRLSLGEMTIDGNENIDITPSDGKIKDDNKGDGSDNTGGNGNAGIIDGNKPNDNVPNPSDENKPDGSDNKPETVIKKEVSVNLLNAKAGINSLDASFQIVDTDNFIKGNLLFTLINVDTGKTVYWKNLANTLDIQDISISSLSPDGNYIMTITDQDGNIQYFQKAFKTNSLDINLVRDYVTTSSLAYSIDFGKTDVKSVKVKLKDKDSKDIAERIVYNSSDTSFVFDGLERNTTYNVLVDEVTFNNVNNASVYTINTSDTTLKERPVLGSPLVSVSSDGKEFTLRMGEVVDEDKSIFNYTYEIYKAKDITEDGIKGEAVYSFSSTELKDHTLRLGDNGLVSNVDYRYRVIADYNDNYKRGKVETGFSSYFQIVGKPIITFSLNEEETSFNQISGIVTIKDEGCTVPNSGRSCFDKSNDIVIKYYKTSDGRSNSKELPNVRFVNNDNGNDLSYNLKLSGLLENTSYTFEVYADIDLQNGEGLRREFLGDFSAKTDGVKSLEMNDWKLLPEYSFNNPIVVETELTSTDPSDTSIDKVATITFNLYSGDVTNVALPEPIGTFTTTENIRDLYYMKRFKLTTSMFNIDNLDALREKSGGKLSNYYTIEVTDAYDEGKYNQFKIENRFFAFAMHPILLLEDQVSEPFIEVTPIKNEEISSGIYDNYNVSYDSSLEAGTIRGYKVIAKFDKDKIEQVLKKNNSVRSVTFYVCDDKGNDILSKDVPVAGISREDKTVETYFFLDYGTEYDVDDNANKELRRGNSYKFAYKINLSINNDDGKIDGSFPSNRPMSKVFDASKRDPIFKMYIDNSTNDSITYKYLIVDVDNALVKDTESGNYLLHYNILDNSYSSVIEKSDSFKDVTLNNLSSGDVYTISYDRGSMKNVPSSDALLDKYYFDGYHDGVNAGLRYSLEYGMFDNRLKVILEDNDFLDRVSGYLLTLKAGNEKIEKFISDFNSSDVEDCNGNKCIIVDYAEITKSDRNTTSVDLKGKDVKVSLVAFYDTGYIGFSQSSKLGTYFKDLGLVSDKDANKVGFVYQNNSVDGPGGYIYIKDSGNGVIFNKISKPMGILGFDIVQDGNKWTFNTSNLVDISNNKFVSFGSISSTEENFTPIRNGIYRRDVNSINVKVLDKVDISTDDNNFKFTSFTPKVTSKVTPIINGGIFNTILSIDNDTLKNDFVMTDGKYKFYIYIYKMSTCPSDDESCVPKEEVVKKIETDYDSLSETVVTGLDPDTEYTFKISADMNKNNKKEEIFLFDNGKNGYVEYKGILKTLDKSRVLKGLSVTYTSSIDGDVYSRRILNSNTTLKTKMNMDILYEIYDNLDNLVYSKTVTNDNITEKSGSFSALYSEDISGNDFVFGADYYTLKVFAVTTDLGKKLSLYDGPIKQIADGTIYIDVPELAKPVFDVVDQEPIISTDYKHSIKYRLLVTDKSRVINDGKYFIELRTSNKNACANPLDCQIEVNMLDGTYKFGNGKTGSGRLFNNGLEIEFTFDDLKANTVYDIYAYANIYRNNVSLSEEEKNDKVQGGKSQSTKSDLGFSLGSVTATASGKNRLLLTFIGAANLTDYLKGIDYSIVAQNGDTVDANIIGSTDTVSGSDIVFTLDSDRYPYVSIDIPEGRELGENNKLYVTYYYLDKSDNKIKALKLGEDTVFRIDVTTRRS